MQGPCSEQIQKNAGTDALYGMLGPQKKQYALNRTRMRAACMDLKPDRYRYDQGYNIPTHTHAHVLLNLTHRSRHG